MDNQVQDPLDQTSRFSDQVYTPPVPQTGKQAVINDLLAISDRVLQLREARASVAGDQTRIAELQYSLLQQESEVGAKVFGAINPSQQRSFFCLDRKTWIWYEAWTDPNSHEQMSQTMRYEINPDSVGKFSQVVNYQLIDGRELENFYNAVKVYSLLIEQQIYAQ